MPLRYLAGAAMGGTQAAVRGLHRARPAVRRQAASLFRKGLPSGGFGPTGERMEDWSWRMAVNARTVGGHHVRTDLEGEGQPGYLATGKMLGEAGLLLSEEGATPERSRLPDPGRGAGHRRAGPLPPRRRPHPGLLLAITSSQPTRGFPCCRSCVRS